MPRKTETSCREILVSAERAIERLRNHAGVRNRTIDRMVVGLTELRASLAKRSEKRNVDGLRYGVAMSVLFLDSDYGTDNTFRHDTAPCAGCERLVIAAKSRPVVCEECLVAIVDRDKVVPA